jgi:Protein of unknown function (DUF998)
MRELHVMTRLGTPAGGDLVTKALIACGAIGGPLFIAAFLVEGTTRDGYDPVRQPVSSLALGQRGWTQRANFIATGLLMLACSRGLHRQQVRQRDGSRWSPRLVGAYGVGLIGAGIFVTDPVRGYDPGPPVPPGSQTNALHGAFSLLVFGALTGSAFLEARHFAVDGNRRWAIYSAATGALVVIGLGLCGPGFAQADEDPAAAGLANVAGLIQRGTIAVGWSWLSLLALNRLRRKVPGSL